MADNFSFTEGSGKTGAADEIAGVLYPRVKIAHGADGSATDVSTSSPLPVQLRDSDGTDVALSGKLGSLTETAPATDTASSGLNGRLQRIAQRLTSLIALFPTLVSGRWPVDGSGVTQPVSGTFWQATQPVSEADGSNVTLGSKADAKSTATDTTAVTAMSVWKQISSSVQAIATSVAGTLTVGTHAVTQSGTWTVQPGNTANTTAWKVDGSAVTQPISVADGSHTTFGAKADAKSTATDTTAVSAMSVWKQISSSVQAIATSVAGTLTVGTHAVTQSGTWTVQPGNTANTTAWKVDGSAVTQPVSLATNTPVGTVAHDGVDSGAPMKTGGRARSSEIAAVANDDRSDFITDLTGKQIVLPYANPENFVSGAITSAMTGTTSTSLIAAPAAGLRNYITQITVSNSHATVGTDVIIQDGSGGTTLYTIPAAAVYGGATVTFPVPLRQPTTATAIYCANVTTGASTKVSASGYKGA